MASAIQTNPIAAEANVGRVTTPIVVENLRDVLDLREGKLADDRVRRVFVEKAIVDTGAATLSLPSALVQQLGLLKLKTKRVMTSRGVTDCNVYSAVRLTIQDRDCSVDVFEVPDGVPALVGTNSLGADGFCRRSRQPAADGKPGTQRRVDSGLALAANDWFVSRNSSRR